MCWVKGIKKKMETSILENQVIWKRRSTVRSKLGEYHVGDIRGYVRVY